MRKIFIMMAFASISIGAHSQDHLGRIMDKGMVEEIFRGTVAILVLLILAGFIVKVASMFLTDRLKRKMIDRHTPADIVSQLLPTSKEQKHANIKWFILLTAAGIGLLIAGITQPLGIHSLAVMVFSIALGFLCYYLFTKK